MGIFITLMSLSANTNIFSQNMAVDYIQYIEAVVENVSFEDKWTLAMKK